MTDDERFWSKVNKDGPLWNGTQCWMWVGKINNGYGRITAGGMLKKAHRYSYEVLVGAIEVGKELDHLCRRMRCVNPAHLEAVSHHENVLRGVSPMAINARKTHCPQGHPYAGDNLLLNPKTKHRLCRTCHREHVNKASRLYYHRKKQRAKQEKECYQILR